MLSIIITNENIENIFCILRNLLSFAMFCSSEIKFIIEPKRPLRELPPLWELPRVSVWELTELTAVSYFFTY